MNAGVRTQGWSLEEHIHKHKLMQCEGFDNRVAFLPEELIGQSKAVHELS